MANNAIHLSRLPMLPVTTAALCGQVMESVILTQET